MNRENSCWQKEVEIYLGILIGVVTFSGSLIAFGKLNGKIGGKPLMLPARHFLNLALLLITIYFGYEFLQADTVAEGMVPLMVLTVVALLFGIHMVMAIGGADMPVVVSMNNGSWQRVRKKAGIPDLHVHDLRHTVGMRLREAEVREETIADILWHTRQGMTAHYSVGQIAELVEALNRITDERHRTNRSLAMITREARIKSPPKVPAQRKSS